MRVLLVAYPREKWDAHANLGGMARFWLSRHAMFRELSATIEQVTEQFRAGKLPPIEFARQFVPRLQFILDQLNAHHQIEDFHYFPIFRAADTRLASDLRFWKATITTFTAIWRAPLKPPTRCYRRCEAMRILCAAAATPTPMRAQCC